MKSREISLSLSLYSKFTKWLIFARFWKPKARFGMAVRHGEGPARVV